MATASLTDVDELISCPVCFEHYRDPRHLKCAHQFCLQCLEKIAVTRPNGQREITCPTCRAVTPLTPGSQVRDLPRPVLMNEVQKVIKKLLSAPKKTKRNCDLCDNSGTMATTYCYDCQGNMCDTCFDEHLEDKINGKHKTATISDLMFCDIHSEVVTMYCAQCKVGICKRCAAKDHRKHEKEEIGEKAKQSRKMVRKFVRTQHTSDVSPEMIELVQGKVQEIESLRDTVIGKLDLTLAMIKTLEYKVRTARLEVVAKTTADIKALNMYTSDLSELNASQASLVELGQYLVEKASDPEVVARATELPSPTSMTSVTSPPTVSIPVLNDTWEKLYDCLKCPRPMIAFNTLSHPDEAKKLTVGKSKVSKPNSPPLAVPLTRLTYNHSVKEGVYDVAFNPSRSQLAAKTYDKSAPIKVYDLKGNKLTQFGGDIDGLSGRGSMSLDSHRDLYLAACDGHLTTVTMDGHRKDRIDLEGCNLSGVTYIRENDLYVVSDITYNKIKLIDPRTKSVVRSFGSTGTSPGQFSSPSFITTYTDQGKPVIVVSDRRNHRVQLLDLYGTHLHTYGSYGQWEGRLNNPRGVVADPTGRIIVCDYSNNRVVSFWREDGQDKWQCLIPWEQLQWRPYCIDIDSTHKTLAVGNGTVKLYSYI